VLVTAVSGAILVVMGLLILSGELTQLNSKAQHALSGMGLDFLYNL
jgi:cytochrome c-type biogenesis protein